MNKFKKKAVTHNTPRILLCGDWRYEVYEEAMAKAMHAVGAEVIPFKVSHFFVGLSGKIQGHIPFWNPTTIKMHLALWKTIRLIKPDFLLLWRCTSISPTFLKLLKRKTNIKLLSYNNDDPFSFMAGEIVPWRYRYLWSWYLSTTLVCDKNFFYRPLNIKEAKKYGSINPTLLMPYFRPWRDRVIDLSSAERDTFCGDVVFVGHYEADGRDLLIRCLIDAGMCIRLYGNNYWNQGQLAGYEDKLGQIREAVGEDYVRALNASPIALCLFSKINRDEYTRRSFEIPACGTVLLSERTPAMLEIYREDLEAVYFSSHEEAVQKARWLLANPDVRNRISLAGQRRVHQIGGSIIDRADFVIKEIYRLQSQY